MSIQDVINEIHTNYEEIERLVDRLDLELLPEVMQRRSALIELFVRSLGGGALSADAAHDAIRTMKAQSFLLETRIASRLGQAEAELQRLYDGSQRSGAYLEELRRNGCGTTDPSDLLC